MTVTATTVRAQVCDGTGTATIWNVIERRSGRTEWVEFVGRVVGVHTEAEAVAAWKAEKG